MFDIPYWLKLTLLLTFLGTVAGIEIYIKKEAANRWREYIFLLTFGFFVTIVGLVHDQIVVTISPEYFSVLKALGVENLRFNTAVLGMKAGFCAGLVMAGILLIFNKQRQTLHLFNSLRTIIPLAFIFLIIGATVGFTLHLLGIGLLKFDESMNMRLMTVWGVQAGLYAGTAIGTIKFCLKLKREKASQAAPLKN